VDLEGCETNPVASGVQLRVTGLVQGVGFRPTVWRHAHDHGVKGEVLNDGAGVLIRAWGSDAALAAFEAAIVADPPLLARIEQITRTDIAGPASRSTFDITASEGGCISTGIVADAATCPACLAEVLEPRNRRYRYPFTNCTHCGPRISIIRAIPYDRASTSMAAFPMCPACRAEYEKPADRRFHAEPNACPVCGPRAWLEDGSAREIALEPGNDAVKKAADLIISGQILAIKGIGGFHLACDATNSEAVSRLRRVKRRYHKPFALMARDLAMVAVYSELTPAEKTLLSGTAAPIVILDRNPTAPPLAADLASGQSTLGFMLPYTPLHHLLMGHLERPIVLTSANVSNEPQCTENADARHRLAGIADAWLMHDRDIVNRLDDSVGRVIDGSPMVLRRARGLAPEPIPLPQGFDQSARILALGAELKSTFCLVANGRAIVSQHIGDLEDAATHDDYRAALDLYRRLFAFDPKIIAVDRHPDYLSTQWGKALAAETGATLVEVQHHHAHVAAVLAEHGVPADHPPVLGITLDGLGFGEDGTFWGGEFLYATSRGYERVGTFAAPHLIGGNKAMREPWRNAFAHLDHAGLWPSVSEQHPDLKIVKLIETKSPALLRRMIETGINAPRASSAGRIFDAAAAILDIYPEHVSYEGQAAIALETLAEPFMSETTEGYPVTHTGGSPIVLTWGSFWQALIDDLAGGVDRGLIAARVHRGLIVALSKTANEMCRARKARTVVLSGGVFQNRILISGLTLSLRGSGLETLTPAKYPANDGGISLGQALVAASVSQGP
jgi:hydrogenase maturation protein HypF